MTNQLFKKLSPLTEFKHFWSFAVKLKRRPIFYFVVMDKERDYLKIRSWRTYSAGNRYEAYFQKMIIKKKNLDFGILLLRDRLYVFHDLLFIITTLSIKYNIIRIQNYFWQNEILWYYKLFLWTLSRANYILLESCFLICTLGQF